MLKEKYLINFALAENYACNLYQERSKYTDKSEIYDLVKKKFPRNQFVLEAVDAAAESWNYHDESGPWMDDLKEKLKKKNIFFNQEDLKGARYYVDCNVDDDGNLMD